MSGLSKIKAYLSPAGAAAWQQTVLQLKLLLVEYCQHENIFTIRSYMKIFKKIFHFLFLEIFLCFNKSEDAGYGGLAGGRQDDAFSGKGGLLALLYISV